MNVPSFLLLKTALTLLVPSVSVGQCQRRVCHYTSSAQNAYTQEAKFHPENIDPTLCTHIVFRHVNFKGNTVVPAETYDVSTNSLVGNYEKVIKLKKETEGLKILLSLSSGNYCNRGPFFAMSGNKSSRQEFINNIMWYLRKHMFDGLYLVCGFFGAYVHVPNAKEALTNLTAELRDAFNQENTRFDRLELALSIYGISITDDRCYDVPGLSKNVDWIDMEAFRLYGWWNYKTRHHAPLFPEIDKGMRFSLDTAVQHWLNKGTPNNKIVIGLPAFGITYTLTSSQTDEGAPALDGGIGPYTKYPGLLSYYEVCKLIFAKGTLFHFLRFQRVPYLVSRNQWVGYDSIGSVAFKIIYLKKKGLGGFSLVSLDMDDFNGHFCEQGIYPLLTAANLECDKDFIPRWAEPIHRM